MANWVRNRVTFDCDHDTYLQIRDLMVRPVDKKQYPLDFGTECVDFTQIVPEPEYETDDAWYDWRIENWGCKWNASDCEILDTEQEFIFSTPWNRPAMVMAKLAKMFPHANIHHMFADEYPNFVGFAEYEDGYLTRQETWEGNFDGIYLACWGDEPLEDDDEETKEDNVMDVNKENYEDLFKSITDILNRFDILSTDGFVKAIAQRVIDDADDLWNGDDIRIAIRNELNEMIENRKE